MSEILTSQKLIDAAMQAWATDKDLYARSEKSAEALGAALIEVEKALPYGAYGPWLKTSGISVNRASYCVRKVNGKDAAYKAKKAAAPHVTALKPGMLVRWDERVFKVMCGSFEESDKYLILNVVDAPQATAEPEPVSISEPENGIVFNVLEMQACVERLSTVVACKAQEPIYSNVLLSSDEKGVVRLLGVDIDKSLTVTLPTAKWFGPAAVAACLEYEQLKKLVNGFQTKEASIAFADGRVSLSSGGFECNMQTHSVAKFTELAVVQAISEKPVLGGFSIGLPGLKEQIEQVLFAVPQRPDGKFEAPSILLESTLDTLRLVATDGFSIAISSVTANLGEFSFTMPKPLVGHIAKMEGDEVSIVDTEDVFYVSTELELLTYNGTHFEFPPYAKVIPAPGTFPTSIFVDARMLAAALKRLHPNADAKEPGVMFTVAENGKSLELHATYDVPQATGDHFVREGRDEIPAAVVGSTNHFKINLKRLLPFLERVEGKIQMVCRDALHVIDMHAHGGTQLQPVYRFLQMPMRLTDAAVEAEQQKAASVAAS